MLFKTFIVYLIFHIDFKSIFQKISPTSYIYTFPHGG